MRLRHPGIVEVYEYGVDESGAFYTMELLEGHDLSTRAPMAWREVCACLREVVSALGVLHARRVVHRDINPRNVWRLPDGRLKLLDFGALSSFGAASEIVGTPAFVSPEALEGKNLDQRTDLFAVGALGYWLLTSAHAYRATHLGNLKQSWERAPASPSSFAKHIAGADQEIPNALEALILSLLRLDAAERPQSTADVLDLLNALTDARAEVDASALRGYLESSVFVGRKREREQFSAALASAANGNPRALWIDAHEGLGRSRFVAELTTHARLEGATVLSLAAAGAGRPYATAIALCRALLIALPQTAREAAEGESKVLASLDPELAAALGKPALPSVAQSPAQESAERQHALSSWFLRVTQSHTLALLVDDLHHADEESQALLATLARAELGARLLVVGTVSLDSPVADAPMLRTFGAAARHATLPALTGGEMRDLMVSVFGEVPYLDRLAARIDTVSNGNPSHALMLVRHLVSTGAVRYAEGAFLLPAEMPDNLPSTRAETVAIAYARLPEVAQRLARIASMPDDGALTRTMLAALAEDARDVVDGALKVLLDERLVRESREGVTITDASLRDKLWTELPAELRIALHQKAAQLLASDAQPLTVLRRALHLLRAGDYETGERLLLEAARFAHANQNYLRAIAPMFETGYTLLKAAQRDAYSLAPPLGLLAMAAYLADRGYGERHGFAIVEVLQKVLRFDLARHLRPFVGGKLALIVALIFAGSALKRRRMGMQVKEVISWLVPGVMALAGAAYTCVDPARGRRYAEALDPLLALGKEHGAALLKRYCLAMADGIAERQADCHRELASVLARLRDPEPIVGLPENHRMPVMTGTAFGLGMMQCLTCDGSALALAKGIEGFNPLAALQADQVRGQHYTYRGDRARTQHYRKCVELQAI